MLGFSRSSRPVFIEFVFVTSMLCPGPELLPPASTSTACSSCCPCVATSCRSCGEPSKYVHDKLYTITAASSYILLMTPPPPKSPIPLQCCSRTAARQLDRNITFHKLVAYMIAFHTGEGPPEPFLSIYIRPFARINLFLSFLLQLCI